MKPTDELYFKYAGVITSVVNKYAYNFPELADDLYLQAQLVFCQACLTYDPEKTGANGKVASFETWLRNKLKSLNMVIRKEIHGPCTMKHLGNPQAITVTKLAQDVAREPEDDPIDISDAVSQSLLKDYSDNLAGNIGESHDYPEELIPYICALRGDSLRVFKDFCEGRFEREPRKNLTKAMQRARSIYDPHYLYRKVYRDCGWSLARVQNAWRGLHGILKNYLDGKMPAPITMATVTLPQNRKKARWRERFDELHKIPVSTYKALVQAGVISPIKKGRDENLDLSKYLLQTFTY